MNKSHDIANLLLELNILNAEEAKQELRHIAARIRNPVGADWLMRTGWYAINNIDQLAELPLKTGTSTHAPQHSPDYPVYHYQGGENIEDIEIGPDATDQSYIVSSRGESLKDVAAYFFDSSDLWPILQKLNPKASTSARHNRLPPGMPLRIPSKARLASLGLFSRGETLPKQTKSYDLTPLANAAWNRDIEQNFEPLKPQSRKAVSIDWLKAELRKAQEALKKAVEGYKVEIDPEPKRLKLEHVNRLKDETTKLAANLSAAEADLKGAKRRDVALPGEHPAKGEVPSWAAGKEKEMHHFNPIMASRRELWLDLANLAHYLNFIQTVNPEDFPDYRQEKATLYGKLQQMNKKDLAGFAAVLAKAREWHLDVVQNPWKYTKGDPAIVYKHPNGFAWKRIESVEDLKREGDDLVHCCGNYVHTQEFVDHTHEYYSLRNAKDRPQITLQVKLADKVVDKNGESRLVPLKTPKITEIKGIRNATSNLPPALKLMAKEFVQGYLGGFEVANDEDSIDI